MEYPENLKYASTHEWASAEENNTVRMGITDFAQDALGDVVYIELPEVGATVRAGEPCSEVESTKSVSDVHAPVTGTVTSVNEALETNPELVNSSPYAEGWFAVIEITTTDELDQLLTSTQYQASVE